MKIQVIALTTICFSVMPSLAQDRSISVIGSGQSSCAAWITGNASADYQAVGWILSFWSGSNRFSQSPNNGDTVDVAGLVQRVRMECERRPDWVLMHVAGLVYDEYQREGR